MATIISVASNNHVQDSLGTGPRKSPNNKATKVFSDKPQSPELKRNEQKKLAGTPPPEVNETALSEEEYIIRKIMREKEVSREVAKAEYNSFI